MYPLPLYTTFILVYNIDIFFRRDINSMNNKIVIIGCGNVGASYAYGLVNQKTSADELVLIDADEDKPRGLALDLSHCIAYSNATLTVRVGSYQDCEDANIVCITAGTSQTLASRTAATKENARIIKDIISKIMRANFKGILLIASNPLDVMCYAAWKYSKLPPHRIIGSGTSLDTARLRSILANTLQISPKRINANVLGEHGDTQFVAWSSAKVNNTLIYDYLKQKDLDHIEDMVRKAGYEIVKYQGYTCYGIAMCLTKITEAILEDTLCTMPVSCFDEKNQIFISSPAMISKDGIIESMRTELNTIEKTKYQNSVKFIKEVIAQID